jgi:hypothetical protein
MDSFGVMPKPVTSAQSPFIVNSIAASGRSLMRFAHGKLFVSVPGDCQVIISNALGRTLKVFNGKGPSVFDVNFKTLAQGIYFVNVRAKDRVETGRLIVN